MKKISIVIPTFNEEDNVVLLSDEIKKLMNDRLYKYDFEIVFIDNASTDNTQILLRGLCADNKKIKAILNEKNFGQFNSPYYGLMQTSGDCAILMCADFQDPVEMLENFVNEWENGFKVVIGIKTKSEENRFIRFLRTCYYRVIKKYSDVEQIEHFTGFGLYDKSFISTLRELNDPTPFLRGIVAELGPERKEISYTQKKRRAGKTKNNWYSLYDAAMLSFTSYTKIGLRLATFLGFFLSVVGIIVAFVYLVLKLLFWDDFMAGMSPILIGVYFFGSFQLFFIGILGEYIMNMNNRVMNRPLVVEKERINFDD